MGRGAARADGELAHLRALRLSPPPPSPSPSPPPQLVLCGDSSVGKTNLLSRFTRNEFVDDSKSTIGTEFATRIVEVSALGRKYKVKVQIWDTAGQERYRAVTRTYYRDALGCLLVYSVASSKSLKHLDSWLAELRQQANADPVLALVGNKVDLKRKVERSEGESFARLNSIPIFMETSAKTGEKVDELFIALAEHILRKNPALDKANRAAIAAGQNIVLDDDDNLLGSGKKKKGCC